MRGARWTRRASVVGGWGAFGLALAVNGCELQVTDTLPDFTCLPGMANVCPPGSRCDVHGRCVKPASITVGNDASDLDGATGDARADDSTGSDGDRDSSNETDGPSSGTDGDHQGAGDARPLDAGEGGSGEGGTCSGVGCRCSGAADCANGFCAGELTVTHALFVAAGSANFCSQPCCSSADCPAATVCFASGAGGNYCVL